MIYIKDNFLDVSKAKEIHEYISNLEYKFGRKSNKKYDVKHWYSKKILNTPLDIFIKKFNININRKETVYVNAHTYGIEPCEHIDKGYFKTYIYYPLLNWKTEWGGGTIIYDDKENYISYIGNRLLEFDSSLKHKAAPINKGCNELRSVVVIKKI